MCIVLKLNLARTGPGPSMTFWNSDLCKDHIISHLSDAIWQNLTVCISLNECL